VSDEVLVDVADGVATVTLNRPDKRNALNSAIIDQLPPAVSEASQRSDVSAIVVTGAGRGFCAGLDLDELSTTGANLGLPDGPYGWPWVSAVPVIGAINGPAIAGGFELAVHCDILIASHGAVFGDTHARIGQLPGAGLTVRLVQLVGIQRARLLCLSSRVIDAATAAQWGLVSEVHPPGELLEEAVSIGRDIASNDDRAVVALGEHFDLIAERAGDAGMADLFERMESWNDQFEPNFVAERRDETVDRTRRQL
jgi:enoyl-CoA hydratase